MISEFSTDFLNVNGDYNFDQKPANGLRKVGSYSISVVPVPAFSMADKKTMSCQYEWCNQGVKAVSESHQNFPLKDGPAWINSILANSIVHLINPENSLAIGVDAEKKPEKVNRVIIAIPISYKNDVRGFWLFRLKLRKRK